MKRRLLVTALAIMSFVTVNAQITVSGDITSNTTWTNDNIYMLSGGFVYVTNNATLTIEPGTLIKGNASTLVVTRGAKLIADGTQTQPIVFTSYQSAGNRAPGDWGGVILLGRAPINDPAGERLGEGGIDPVKGLFGGTDVNDNSGIVRYVRIEYAGIAYQPNNETNGLTMGGVGMGTTIDYVQVSHGGDDAFEWFGGTVNCKHLIANKTLDDMFDTDYGFSGKIQFVVGLSDSLIADISGSNGFESDNDATGTTNGPLTKPIFTNASIFGPKMTATTNINANFKRALHLRRSTSTCVYNSIFSGFPTGLKIESDNSASNAKNGSLQFKNNIVAGCAQSLDSIGLTITWGAFNSMLGWFNSFSNSVLPNSTDLMGNDPYNYSNPDFTLQGTSPAISGADFTSANLNNSFFTPTTYRGAFDGTNDWTSCWANFDPQNTPYTSATINYLPINVSVSGATTFCQGDLVTLTSDVASNITWSTGATTASINAVASGSYTVTATNASGCMVTTAPVVVTVNPLPAPMISANGPITFCQGGSVQLSTGSFTTYNWSNGSVVQDATINTSGNHFVTVTDANGCQASSATTTVTVNPLPATPVISANGPTSFCTGGSVTLSSSAASGNDWSTGETTQSIVVTTTGSYTVTVTDANSCQASSNTTLVDVSATPVPTVSVSGSLDLCQGDAVTLTSSQGDTYSWSNGATTSSINVTTAGTYFVTTTNADACLGVGQSANTVVTVTALPVSAGSLSVSGNVVTFTNTSTGATGYLWDFGDQSTSSATTPVHAYAANGQYTVTLTAINGNCSDVSTYTANITVGIDEISLFENITMYPNPATDFAKITLTANELSHAQIQLLDLSGKVISEVFNGDLFQGANNIEINTAALPSGMYYAKITSEKSVSTLRLMIAK